MVNVRSPVPRFIRAKTVLFSIDLEPDVFLPRGVLLSLPILALSSSGMWCQSMKNYLDDGVTVSVTASGISLQFRGAPGQEKKIVAVEPRKPGFFARLIDGLKS